MAADNFVVVRRTISQTLVPYKEVQEKLLLRRSREKGLSERSHFGSTITVARCGEAQWRDSAKRVTFNERSQSMLERSRSEVCLRRKSSYVRETTLDVSYEEGREQNDLVKPILRRREHEPNASRRANSVKATRPKSDFFAEFEVKFKNRGTNKRAETKADERLGRCIDVLRKEMLSLRQQDNELLKQLTTLNEHIQDLKELSRVNGGLFGSCEDGGNVGEQLNTSSPVVQMRDISRAAPTRTDPLRREKCGNSEGHVRNQSVNSANGRVKTGDGIRRFQETSFEYEEPLRVAAQQRTSPAKSPKRPQPAGKPTVNVTRQPSLRLERKSVSCQFLDSRGTDARNKRYSGHLESLGKRVNSMTISENCNENSRNANAKQKSLSMTQLRRTTKATEVSTSDSECSTSGCYGGSSTGSEFESERHVTHVESSTDEERETRDKAHVLKSVKKKQGYHPPSTTKVERFRKQIVSV